MCFIPQKHIYALQLKKTWMEDDSHLFNAEDKKFTDIGYKSYWNAVDKTVKFAHTLLLKKEALASQKKTMEGTYKPTLGERLPN